MTKINVFAIQEGFSTCTQINYFIKGRFKTIQKCINNCEICLSPDIMLTTVPVIVQYNHCNNCKNIYSTGA